MADVDDLQSSKTLRDQIAALSAEIQALKQGNTNNDLVKARVTEMMEKKALVCEDSRKKFELRCPRGTRDYGPYDMAVRKNVLEVIENCFKRHGAVTLDTPIFELKDVLLGKYGEEGGKLIYDLADQGGESLSLRYDLTVPFARYLAMNKDVKTIKRYHIGKVYRRDNPSRGRFREFYQCDFDIAGVYDPMIPEAELLRIVFEVLNQLDIGAYDFKVNHRLLLDGMFDLCGIKSSQFKTVCSSIDKLDKLAWMSVRDELCNEKGVPEDVVNKLERYLRLRENDPSLSNADILNWFENDEIASKNSSIQKAVTEMRLLLDYCDLYGTKSLVVIEPSLARGLDYYTGAIFEVVLKDNSSAKVIEFGDSEEMQGVSIGSVAGGGRYDSLVSMFLPKQNVPCVGISLGIERLFTIMKEKKKMDNLRPRETEVLVTSAQKNLLKERMKLCRLLWDNKIKAEMALKANPKMLNQMQYCEDNRIPLAVIVGERELQEGIVKIRDVPTRTEEDIARDDLLVELRRRLDNL